MYIKINLRDLQLDAVFNTSRQSLLAEFHIPTARLQDLPNIAMQDFQHLT
jgi:hypothetical protein